MLKTVLTVVIINLVMVCQPSTAAGRCAELETKPRRFSEAELHAIHSAALQIDTLVGEKDIVIFLGRSPLWFGQAFRYLAPARRAIDVAFSGQPYRDQWSRPTDSQVMAFRAYLTNLGLDLNALMKTKRQRLIVVDHLQSGEGVYGFSQILARWLSAIGYDHWDLKRKLLIVNLTHAQIASMPRTDLDKKDVLLPFDIIIPLANAEDDQSLGVFYPYRSWDQVDPRKVKPSKTARAMQKQLLKWLAKD